MSNHRPTDAEIAQKWAEAVKEAHENLARRQRLQDAFFAAGFATPKPVLQGEAE